MARGRVEFEGFPASPQVALRAGIKAGIETTLAWWHRHYRPRHFGERASARYGYKPRQGEREARQAWVTDRRGRRRPNTSYTRQKLLRYGHTRPLVWTGRSQARSAAREVRKYRGNWALVMDVPNYFYKYRVDLNQPDKAAELTRILPAEQEVMARRGHAAAVRTIQRWKGRKVRRLT